MESNKFDDHIKNLLDKRSIEPSVNAWSNIEERLNSTKTAKRNWMLWSGVAASFIGVLITISVLNTNTKVITVVEAPVEINEDVINSKENSKEYTVATPKPTIENKQASPIYVSQTKNNSKTTFNKAALTPETDQLINKEPKMAVVEKDLQEIPNSTLDKANSIKITYKDEAESLLAQALQQTTSSEPKSSTIDAASLLYDVEVEVEQSFRTKLFATIKENLSDIKTVIVDRNK